MKESDLRIGNTLKGGNVKTVGEGIVTFDSPKKRGRGYGLMHNNCKPALLTELWLYKLCFKECEKGLFRRKKVTVEFLSYGRDKIINGKIERCDETGWYVYFNNKELKPVRYVHKLQNIYFELMEEELI